MKYVSAVKTYPYIIKKKLYFERASMGKTHLCNIN